jgi:hypothetical protein
MKANDADIAEENQHELAAGVLKQTLSFSFDHA